MEFKIEKNITMNRGKDRANKYPIRDLEIGDSFFVPKDLFGVHDQQYCRALASRNKMKVSVKKQDGGYRIWRTA